MSSCQDSILILGSGELGLQVIQAIDNRDDFASTPISVLQRSSSLPPSLLRTTNRAIPIKQCDLSDSTVDELSIIFEPFSIIICCTGFVGGPGTQMKITRATMQAKGPRKLYIPWQFGIDYDKIGRGSGQIVWDEQLDVRDLLRNQDRLDWLIVSTGMFTSFLFEPSFGIVNGKERICRALGAWDNKVTVTCVEDIGKCVASILAQCDDFKNQIIYIGGDTISYGQVAEVVAQRWQVKDEVKRKEWTLKYLKGELDEKPGDLIAMYRFAFAKGIGMSWPLEQCWNVKKNVKLLNLSQWCSVHGIP